MSFFDTLPWLTLASSRADPLTLVLSEVGDVPPNGREPVLLWTLENILNETIVDWLSPEGELKEQKGIDHCRAIAVRLRELADMMEARLK